jgi:hypothetical protein
VRLLALVLLTTVLWAAEQPPLVPTPLTWDAGRATLSTTLTRLAIGGNRVWLAAGIDDAVEAELPAVAGTWWDGVIVLCQAFALRPDEGEASDEQLELPGMPVPVGHGTLVLSSGHRPALQAIGGLLACAEADTSVRLWLRAEPRVGRGRLAWARAEAPSIEPGTNLLLEPAESDGNAPPAAVWQPNAALPPDARLVATVQTATVARWTASCQLTVGVTAQAQVRAEGQTISAIVLVDPAVTTWEGHPLPERRPLVAIAGPDALLQRAQFHLRQGETELATRGGGARNNDKGCTMMYRFLRAAPDGAVALTIDGRLVETPLRHELRLALPATRPIETAPLEAPARLAWEAGQRPLSQWLGLLSATGNPVLPEVGVDTTVQITLPTLRGVFWDGVLALSAATGLAPAQSSESALSGSAVRLVRRQLLAATVCGPVLLDAQRVQAQPGVLALRLRAILEPRLSEDAFAAPAFHWATWATDDLGRVHPLTTSTAEAATDPPGLPGDVVIRRGRREAEAPPAGGPLVVVHLAGSGARRLVLSGLLTLPRLRQWRAAADLVINQPSEVLLGPRAVELTALSAPTRIGANQSGPGLLLRGLHGVAAVQFSLTTSEGQVLEHPGEANRMGGGPLVRPWLGWCRIPGEGRLSAEIVASAALPPLVLPVSLSVPVPDGL